MLRSVTIFSMTLPSPDRLREHFSTLKFSSLLPGLEFTSGFVPASGNPELVFPFDGGCLFSVGIETKAVPANLIRKQYDERLVELGVKSPNKDFKRQLLSEIRAELTARALPRHRQILSIYDYATERLFVGSTNRRALQTVTQNIVRAVESVKTHTIWVSGLQHSLTARLERLLASSELEIPFGSTEAFGPFSFGDSLHLVRPLDGAKASFSAEDLMAESNTILELLQAGYQAVSLGLYHTKTGVSFTFTSDFKMKSVKVPIQAEDEDTDEGSDEDMQTHELNIARLYFSSVAQDLTALFEYTQEAEG